jgi:diaminohydroxyphosphoribosylaminopyrimidine deaminase/5-amino-6-(5-phosphoribosylamino)uracil reductase
MNNRFNQLDKKYMRYALRLARKGEGTVSPNPMVGAVIVINEKIVGRGFHNKAGGAHAEAIALMDAGEKAKEATLYVNLEPCNHHGRTPPCGDAIISAGIKRVVIGILDPNTNVKGGGMATLLNAGIEVSDGVMKDEAALLNEKYLYNVASGLPFVILKMGVTLDGKIATKTGDSQWITSKKARRFAHQLRKSVDAVATGSGTAIKDNPHLTVRLNNNKYHCHRIVFDTKLSVPVNSNLFNKSKNSKLYIIASKNVAAERLSQAEQAGAGLIQVSTRDGRIDINAALERIGKEGITSILLEGGSRLAASFIRENMVNKLVIAIAPLLIGGEDAVPMIGDLNVKGLDDAKRLKNVSWRRLGEEMIFTGYLK